MKPRSISGADRWWGFRHGVQGVGAAARRVRSGLELAACLVLVSCGGKVDETEARGHSDATPVGSSAPSATATATAHPTTRQPIPKPSAEPAPVATFKDPGCPKIPPPVRTVECDPLAPACPPGAFCLSDCFEGEACVPFVDYPDEPCAPETFGTRCRAAGSGVQGSPCAEQGCASGYLCVATGQGTRCAELCALPGVDTCPAGLLCGAVDIEGFGVCF